MANLLSAHYIPTHGRPDDLTYFDALQPAVIKTVDADPHRIGQLYARLPGALYFLRDWALSEQHDDLARDPEGTGRRHAGEWAGRLGAYAPPADQAIVAGINEPRVWDHLREVIAYYTAYVEECTRRRIRAAVLNLSVGWPANNGADTPPDWTPYAPIYRAMQEGAAQGVEHVLVLHEYFDHRGPAYNWGWWCGRFLACPWNVPIVIGECGLDQYVSDPGVPPDRRGWQGQMSAPEYAAAVRNYCERVAADPRVIGACLYTSDYGHPWGSFDTLPAAAQLAAIYVEEGPGAAAVPPVEPGPGPEPEPPTEPPPGPSEGPLLAHPCAGAPITQHWGENGPEYARFGLWGHNGTDFATPTGAPIAALARGVVAYTGSDPDYGLYVRLYHAELRAHSFYAHLSAITVPAGAPVEPGAQIGRAGNTGNSTGPHLHFEIRIGASEAAYAPNTPMPKGRIDPESFCALLGLSLGAVN